MIDHLELDQLVRLLVEGFKLLQNSGQITPPELQLRGIELLNDSMLVASIVPSTADRIGVMTEVCTTMAAMSGFFLEQFALPPTVKLFGVHAFTKDGDEMMYILSSVKVASYCSEGRAIEWLTNSLIVDNTSESRRGRAKLLVSRLEIGMRRLIALRLHAALGATWWNSIEQPIQDSSTQAMKGDTSGGTGSRLPIDYTFLPHLKSIITAFWSNFHDLFVDQSQFEKTMDDLNAIRRPEAHNREISKAQIDSLNAIYEDLAGKMVTVEGTTVPEFLVENWRTRLSEIMRQMADRMPDLTEADGGNTLLIRQTVETQAAVLRDGLSRLRSIVVPPGKEDLHGRFESTWDKLCVEADEMLTAADAGDVAVLEDVAARYHESLDKLRELAAEHLMIELGH